MQKVKAHPKHDALVAEWVALSDVQKLAFDHMDILNDALNDLRYDIQTTNIAAQLLPEKFTLAELQGLYEIILDKELDKRNFRKRLRALDIVKATNETRMEGAHRPALLHKFKTKKYKTIKSKLHGCI